MPLYEVKTKNGTERVRTVAGSPEDKRLAAEGSGAKLVDEPARDVRRGRGRATINIAGTPAQGG